MSEAVTGAPVTPAAAPAAPTAATSTPKPVNVDAPKAAPEFFDVKVDGKTVKMSREEVLKHASLSSRAHEKFEEAAKLSKAAEAKLSKIKTPKAALAFLNSEESGLNKDEVRAEFENWYKETYIDPEGMSEEQRELMELKKEKQRWESERAERERLQKEAEERELDQVESQRVQRELTEMLEEAGMPKTKFTASRLAYWIRVNEAKGINAPKELILQQVKQEQNGIVNSYLKNAIQYGEEAPDRLVQWLGEDGKQFINLLRKYDLKQIRAKRGGGQPQATQQTESQENSKHEKISLAEVRRRAREFK